MPWRPPSEAATCRKLRPCWKLRPSPDAATLLEAAILSGAGEGRSFPVPVCSVDATGMLRVDENHPVVDTWQRQLKVKIVWALAAKLLALTLLWLLFFRAHGA